MGVTLEEPAKKGDQQVQVHQNQQLSGSKRPPPPSKSENKSSCARTRTTHNASTQCSDKNKDSVQCYNCAEFGHVNRLCKKKSRKCFLCGREGHLQRFCKQGEPKPAQSQQESASCNNNTPIGPASEQSMEQKKRKCFKCKEDGHMVASCPQKRGLAPAQFQLVSASSNGFIEPASEQSTEQNKRRCYICKKEGHMLSSCPQGIRSPAQSQRDSASYNNLPFEQSATQNTGAPVASSSQGQQVNEMPNVDIPNAPFAQALESVHPSYNLSQSGNHPFCYDVLRVEPDYNYTAPESGFGPVDVHGNSNIADSRSP